MNKKISAICFILLLFFLICSVSATECKNETLNKIGQTDPNQDLCQMSVENIDEKLELSNTDNEKLKATKTTVTKEKVTLKAPNVKMYYKDGSKFKVTLKDKNKKAIKKAKIKISINGKTYNKVTDSKGTTSISLNLNSGSYNVITSFAETSKYESKSLKSTVTVKSTIKCSDFTKYYKNTACYYSTFYDKKGKLLKNTAVKIKLNNKTYSIKTNSKGVGKLAIDLKPGKYNISVINSKTSETIKKTVTIKTLILTKNLKFNETENGNFSVKILNSYGKASPNKKVTLKLNGNTYRRTTDKNGIAYLELNLNAGTYTITTEFDDIKSTNKITVNEVIKTATFSHITEIPSYVNVTHRYVFDGTYVLKSGINGIIKMPKNELFTINIANKEYLFSKSSISGLKTTVIGYKSYLIPFDGGDVKSDPEEENLKGNGIIISSNSDYTKIEYRSETKNNTEIFGFYADKGNENSETFTYTEDNTIKAKINVKTVNYDEFGLKYSLSKYYGRSIYDFNYKNYDEFTFNNAHLIKFANTNTSVTLNYFSNYIVGYPSKEDIKTKFIINGIEELEKQETISYGLGEKYRKTLGFEVLHAYSIINEKITKEKLEKWISVSAQYLNRFGLMNIYGMHLTSLETAWLADAFADKYSKEFNVTWKRGKTLTILGGINLEDTYLNIQNADMGMIAKGEEKNTALFRLINSINLPNLEDYSLSKIAIIYHDNATNSLDNVFNAFSSNNFSIAQLGEMIYIFSEDNTASAIVLNSTNGVAHVILSKDDYIVKGSSLYTICDCCSVGKIPQGIISGIKDMLKLFTPDLSKLNDLLNNLHPSTVLIQKALTLVLGKTLTGASSAVVGLFSTMTAVQTIGTYYRDNLVDDKYWYSTMDSMTFTRPGYLQGKKVYNIPNKNGGYDYIEVKINDNLTLDRNNAVYISNGKTKQLTISETYQYFSDEYWSPISMPTKYWDKSWGGG